MNISDWNQTNRGVRVKLGECQVELTATVKRKVNQADGVNWIKTRAGGGHPRSISHSGGRKIGVGSHSLSLEKRERTL